MWPLLIRPEQATEHGADERHHLRLSLRPALRSGVPLLALAEGDGVGDVVRVPGLAVPAAAADLDGQKRFQGRAREL